jgi:hypothetical protein
MIDIFIGYDKRALKPVFKGIVFLKQASFNAEWHVLSAIPPTSLFPREGQIVGC